MSCEEIIKRTDYTESELIDLAIMTSISIYRKCRNNSEDFEREKAIKTLESYVTNPLHRKDDKYVISLDVRFVNTIIELLKEQEGVEPIGGEDDD